MHILSPQASPCARVAVRLRHPCRAPAAGAVPAQSQTLRDLAPWANRRSEASEKGLPRTTRPNEDQGYSLP